MENQTPRKPDRRVIRTKKLLLNSLTELMEEKKIKEISVKELADHADVNRGTFYLHYKDVFDMVEQIEKELIDEFAKIIDVNILEMQGDPHPEKILEDIFIFLKKNKETLRALIGPNGDSSLLAKFRAQVSAQLENIWNISGFNREYFEYYNSFIVSGCIGLVETWIRGDCKLSPKTMAELSGRIVENGIAALSKNLSMDL